MSYSLLLLLPIVVLKRQTMKIEAKVRNLIKRQKPHIVRGFWPLVYPCWGGVRTGYSNHGRS